MQRRIYKAAARLFAEKGVTLIGISDLAQAAGVARATVYSQLGRMDGLFERVACQLGLEMNELVGGRLSSLEDPAERLANGVRLFVHRAHVDPQWAAFVSRFAFGDASIRELLLGQVSVDVCRGLEEGRYGFSQSQSSSVISLISGATLGAMFMVQEGIETWREAGSKTAELLLRALGVSDSEARDLAARELQPLLDEG